jgi:hypothetical protein
MRNKILFTAMLRFYWFVFAFIFIPAEMVCFNGSVVLERSIIFLRALRVHTESYIEFGSLKSMVFVEEIPVFVHIDLIPLILEHEDALPGTVRYRDEYNK